MSPTSTTHRIPTSCNQPKGLCTTCHDLALTNSHACHNCTSWTQILGAPPIPIEAYCLYSRDAPIRDLLTEYKNETHPHRQHHTDELINLLHEWLKTTSRPYADGCVVVPSTKGRPPYLADALTRRPLQHYGPPLNVLIASPRQPNMRQAGVDRFSATQSLKAKSLILIDDVYTTGATAQSAAFALEAAGATVKTIYVLGRRINPEALAHEGLIHPAFGNGSSPC